MSKSKVGRANYFSEQRPRWTILEVAIHTHTHTHSSESVLLRSQGSSQSICLAGEIIELWALAHGRGCSRGNMVTMRWRVSSTPNSRYSEQGLLVAITTVIIPLTPYTFTLWRLPFVVHSLRTDSDNIVVTKIGQYIPQFSNCTGEWEKKIIDVTNQQEFRMKMLVDSKIKPTTKS